MKFVKNTCLVSTYILLVVIFFAGGYAIGRVGTNNNKTVSENTFEAEQASVSNVRETVYEVKLENGTLRLSECTGESEMLISSEKISENVFPSDDVYELKEGVKFDTLEKAQSLFENFVS